MNDARGIAPRIEPRAGPDTVTVHATAVALKDYGLLITGDPGSGKTTLALEMMTLGAGLVADDWVVVERGRAGGLVMSPPQPIAGLVEIAGIGMVRLPYTDQAPLMGIVDLNREPENRMPTQGTRTLLGTRFLVIAGKGRAKLASALIAVMRAGGLLDPGEIVVQGQGDGGVGGIGGGGGRDGGWGGAR